MMNKSIRIIAIICLCGLTMAGLHSCQEDVLENPYDKIVYNNPNTGVKPEATSIAGLHQNIFSVQCAVPACHDGAFEPDFRTIESTYSTLVYHPVFKNNAAGDFTYRVIPGDTSLSWLHERITTDDPVLGRMPLYDSMPPARVDEITQWILDGAKDFMGNTPMLPNFEPVAGGVLAYLPNSLNYRVDTIRGGRITNPFAALRTEPLELWFVFFDDQTLPQNFTENKLLLSTDPFDFSRASVHSLSIPAVPKNERLPGSRQRADYTHKVVLDPSGYSVGQVVYMRLMVKDEDHQNVTQTPSDGSPDYLKTYFAFYVAQ